VQESKIEAQFYFVADPVIIAFFIIVVDNELTTFFSAFFVAIFGSGIVIEGLVHRDVNEVIEVVRVGQNVI